MAEIRSTLDIIMEKAKTLTVTDEDKRGFLEKEVEGQVKGFFQKYLDKIFSIDQLKTEMASFDQDRKAVAEKALLAECLGAITTEGDNGPLFEVLENLPGCDIKPIMSLILEFQGQQKQERDKRTIARIQALKEWGVSGSAVVPNLGASSAWRDYLTDMANRFQERLNTLHMGAS